MKEVVDKKTGKKMYTVGRWITYQHVFYNAIDRANIAVYDAQTGDEMDKALDWLDRVEDLLSKWDFNPRVNGIVYAIYEDYKTMKDIIGGYAWRHGGTV